MASRLTLKNKVNYFKPMARQIIYDVKRRLSGTAIPRMERYYSILTCHVGGIIMAKIKKRIPRVSIKKIRARFFKSDSNPILLQFSDKGFLKLYLFEIEC